MTTLWKTKWNVTFLHFRNNYSSSPSLFDVLNDLNSFFIPCLFVIYFSRFFRIDLFYWIIQRRLLKNLFVWSAHFCFLNPSFLSATILDATDIFEFITLQKCCSLCGKHECTISHKSFCLFHELTLTRCTEPCALYWQTERATDDKKTARIGRRVFATNCHRTYSLTVAIYFYSLAIYEAIAGRAFSHVAMCLDVHFE